MIWVFSVSPRDLVNPALRVAVITPFSTLMSNLFVTSSPVTESYALILVASTSTLVSSKSSVIPTVWTFSLLVAENLVVSNHTW